MLLNDAWLNSRVPFNLSCCVTLQPRTIIFNVAVRYFLSGNYCWNRDSGLFQLQLIYSDCDQQTDIYDHYPKSYSKLNVINRTRLKWSACLILTVSSIQPLQNAINQKLFTSRRSSHCSNLKRSPKYCISRFNISRCARTRSHLLQSFN